MCARTMNGGCGIWEVLELITAVRLLQDNSNKEGRLIGGCPLSNKARLVLRKHKPRKPLNGSKLQDYCDKVVMTYTKRPVVKRK